MRKIMRVLMCCCLAVCLAFLATGCGGTSDDGGITGGEGNVLQGGSRPNYDDMFDFESGYTPSDPRDPNKIVHLTMDEKSPITFAGGEKTLAIKYNTALTKENFDLTGIPEGRELDGLSTLRADDNYTAATDLETFRAPYDDTSILPYFNAPVNYTRLEIGSSNPLNLNSITTGSFKNSGTIKFTDNVVVAGGEDALPESGVLFTETSSITIDSAFRTDSKYAVTADPVYAFRYNFENMGGSAIRLNAYQINGSSEHASKYKERYRLNIDLEPGESMTCDYEFKPGGLNGNALTYFVANDDMDTMALGMSMSALVTELTEPETVNPATEYTLTLDSGDVTFEDGAKTAQLLERDRLPAVVNNNDYADIVGWYDAADPTKIWNHSTFELRDKKSDAEGSAPVSRFTMPAKNITLVPLFAKSQARALIPAGSALTVTDGVSCERLGTKIFNTAKETGIGNQVGAEFAYGGGDGGSFTLATPCARTSGSKSALKHTEHTFDFRFENTGDESVTFTAYQVNADGAKIAGADTGELTLAAGEAAAAAVTVELAADSDTYTLIELGRDQTAAKLGVVMTKTSKFTLTLGSDDFTFEGGSKTAFVGDTMPLPAVTTVVEKPGADLVGWYDVDEPASFWNQSDRMLRDKNPSGTTGREVAKFAMPDKDTTIAPFFVEKGMRPLIPASAHGIDQKADDISVSRATKLMETPLGMRLGTELTFKGSKYTGTNSGAIAAGTAGWFRMMTSAAGANNASAPGEILEGEHTFNFRFTNLGEETVKFTAYQVTGGTRLDPTKNTGEITLQAGETRTESITLTLGQNNNAMTVFTLGQNQTAAKLGVIMSKSTANEVA